MDNQPKSSRTTTAIKTLLLFAIIIAGLYFGKELLLPLTLAILLSFVLTPLVTFVERSKIGRLASVLVVTAITSIVLGGIFFVVTQQLLSLSAQLPRHKENLVAKVRGFRGQASGQLDGARETIESLSKEITASGDEEDEEETAKNQWLPWRVRIETDADDEVVKKPKKDDALAVKVVEMPPSPLTQLQNWLGPFVAPLSTAGIVAVLVVFILLKREDLRDRFIQVVGRDNICATTDAMNEAGRRVGRYLQASVIVNASYGFALAAGLYFLDLPNAVLFGVLGFMLRFIPYVGPWIGGLLPIGLAIAVFESWTPIILIIGLLILLDVLVNNVMEPWLYGSSLGVTSVGVIVAAIFWAWIWGPVGLVVAMPITVCLVVMGKYVPHLRFLSILLGDERALSAKERLYQRMLARDEEECHRLVFQELQESDPLSTYDELFIPALRMAEIDRQAHRFGESQSEALVETCEALIEDLDQVVVNCGIGGAADAADEQFDEAVNRKRESLRQVISLIPVSDEGDQISAEILAQLLRVKGYEPIIHDPSDVVDDIKKLPESRKPLSAIVISIPPYQSRHGRAVCRRLTSEFPDTNLLALWLDEDLPHRIKSRILQARVTCISQSLRETLDIVDKLRTDGIEGDECAPEKSEPKMRFDESNNLESSIQVS